MANFVAAVRSRRPQDLTAPIDIGHTSTATCHLGNIAHRLGRTSDLATARAAVEAIPDAVAAINDMQRHLGHHGIDLENTPMTVGPWIEVDRANETIAKVAGGGEADLERARFLVKEVQRSPWVIPEAV
jgi:hypothetical protein